MQVFGVVLAVLGGLVLMATVAGFVWVQSVDEHCPPHATCDGKCLFSFVAMVFGAGGLLMSALGGVLVGVAGTRRNGPPSR